MSGPIFCDNHPEVHAKRIVSNVETGEQAYLCISCYASQSVDTVPSAIPDKCEMCNEEPVATVIETVADGLKLALGMRCYLVNARVAWLSSPAEEWEELDRYASAIVDPNGNGQSGDGGRDGGVAVDDKGNPPLAVVPDEEEKPTPKVKPTKAKKQAASSVAG